MKAARKTDLNFQKGTVGSKNYLILIYAHRELPFPGLSRESAAPPKTKRATFHRRKVIRCNRHLDLPRRFNFNEYKIHPVINSDDIKRRHRHRGCRTAEMLSLRRELSSKSLIKTESADASLNGGE